jgi:hypothetical protein
LAIMGGSEVCWALQTQNMRLCNMHEVHAYICTD